MAIDAYCQQAERLNRAGKELRHAGRIREQAVG